MIDMWYGDKPSEIDKIDYGFNDYTGDYRGNVYIKNKAVGDYSFTDWRELEKAFPQFNWNKARD